MPGQVLIYQLIGRFCPVENPVAIFSLEKSSAGRFHGTQSTSGTMFVIAVAIAQRGAQLKIARRQGRNSNRTPLATALRTPATVIIQI
jgi:hypothetical protein